MLITKVLIDYVSLGMFFLYAFHCLRSSYCHKLAVSHLGEGKKGQKSTQPVSWL